MADASDKVEKTDSKLKITGGEFKGGAIVLKNDYYGDILITGGSFENNNGSVITNYNKVKITGGNFTNPNNKRQLIVLPSYTSGDGCSASLTIEGGTFSARYAVIDATGSSNTVNITDGIFTGSYNPLKKQSSNSTWNITGGSFNGEISGVAVKGGSYIKGGVYGRILAESSIADGYYGICEGNVVTVSEAKPVDYKAAINMKRFFVGEGGAEAAINAYSTKKDSPDVLTLKESTETEKELGLGYKAAVIYENGAEWTGLKPAIGCEIQSTTADGVTVYESIVTEQSANVSVKVGDDVSYYATLRNAIDAKPDDGAIFTLLKDHEGMGYVTFSQNVAYTLDLNGHKLVGSDYQIIALVNETHLTIIDSSEGKTGLIKNTKAGEEAIFMNGSNSNAVLNIQAGTFEGDVSVNANAGTLNITGGTLNGGFKQNKGIINITGGTFSSDPKVYLASESEKNIYKYYESKYVVSADKPANTSEYHSWVWDEETRYNVESYNPPAPYIPSTPTDNVTNSGTAGTDNATTSADLSASTTTSNGTTTAAVDKTTADKIVDKAVANKSQEVVIDATANTAAAAASTTTTQVGIPTATLEAIAEKTEADVTVKTDVVEVKLDNTAAGAVAAQATGDTVHIIAEKVKEDAAEVHFELKVVCSNGTVISDFKGGNVAVTVTLPKEMADKKVVCVYIDDNGHMSKVEGQKNADGTYTFVTGHFSTYAIMAEEEADAAIAAQTEAIKNIKIKLTSKQVKTKSGKKGIKITWTAAAGDKVLDGVEVFRSKEKNKGYGTKAFFTSTKGGNKGSYINTKSLKKGTRYYYKVRGYVLVNGEKVYTDYSTKAWRTA